MQRVTWVPLGPSTLAGPPGAVGVAPASRKADSAGKGRRRDTRERSRGSQGDLGTGPVQGQASWRAGSLPTGQGRRHVGPGSVQSRASWMVEPVRAGEGRRHVGQGPVRSGASLRADSVRAGQGRRRSHASCTAAAAEPPAPYRGGASPILAQLREFDTKSRGYPSLEEEAALDTQAQASASPEEEAAGERCRDGGAKPLDGGVEWSTGGVNAVEGRWECGGAEESTGGWATERADCSGEQHAAHASNEGAEGGEGARSQRATRTEATKARDGSSEGAARGGNRGAKEGGTDGLLARSEGNAARGHSTVSAAELGQSSWKEKLDPAAVPAHPGALTAMYWTYVCCCLWEKVWRFGLPAILSMLLPSMQPIALLSFVSQLVIFVAAPWVGQYMDSHPRVQAFNTLCTVQTVAMVVSAVAALWGIRHPSPSGLSGAALVRQPWFLLIMAAGAVDKLTGLAAGVAFERDWVILLAGRNRPIALASANAMLRRVDLFCELAGPISFGWLLSKFPPVPCLNTAIAVSVVSLPLLLLLVKVTDTLSSGALGRPRQVQTGEASSAPSSTSQHATSAQAPSRLGSGAAGTGYSSSIAAAEIEEFMPQSGLAISSQSFAMEEETHVTPHIDSSRAPPTPSTSSQGAASADVAPANQGGSGPLEAAWRGWQSFLGQSVLPASLAYVLLYFNAVLSPGGLMTSFLTQRGVDVAVIGAFRGACAAMGFAATFISAPLVHKLGVLHAGAGALVFQAGLLALSVCVFFWSGPHQQGLLMLFLALVVLSRLGHWVYDVVDAQIFQTAVPSAEANLVGTTEIALASLAELFMLGTAIVLHDVSNFGQLAVLSMASVVLAMVIYCVWLFQPNATRDALFPDRPEWTFLRKRMHKKSEDADRTRQPVST